MIRAYTFLLSLSLLFLRTAITQIAAGGLSMLFGIGISSIPVRLITQPQNQLLGTGIWDGLFFIITGILGIAAANRNVRKKVC